MSHSAADTDATMHDADDTRSHANTDGGSEANNNNEDGSDNEGSGDDEDESSEEEVLEPKILPKRTTRGHRETNMHEEGDDEFWEQEFFADEAEQDVDYEKDDAEQDEEPDEYDSDFFEDEDESDDEEVEAEKEKKGKKAGAYIDPKHQAAKRAAAAKKAVATKAARKAAAAAAATTKVGIDTGAIPPVTVHYDDDGFPTGQEGGLPPAALAAAQQKRRAQQPSAFQLSAIAAGRKSVRKATMDSSMETSRKEAEIEKRRKESKPKVKFVQKIYTQDELLKQSIETEKENIKSLENLLRIEEEKKKDLLPKMQARGDRIEMRSVKRGPNSSLTFITFTNGQIPDYLKPEPPSTVGRSAVCCISGKKAHFIDPVTHLPYAGLAEFKQLRSKTAAAIKQLQAAYENKRAPPTARATPATSSTAAAAPSPSPSPPATEKATKKRKHEEVKTAAPATTTTTTTTTAAAPTPLTATIPQQLQQPTTQPQQPMQQQQMPFQGVMPGMPMAGMPFPMGGYPMPGMPLMSYPNPAFMQGQPMMNPMMAYAQQQQQQQQPMMQAALPQIATSFSPTTTSVSPATTEESPKASKAKKPRVKAPPKPKK